MTAAENVSLPLMFQGFDSFHRQSMAHKYLKLVGLDDRMHHKPSELSGGQQQRVAIARALANDPQMILADEPTGNLDSSSGENVLQFLHKLHKNEGTTIVMVTHDSRVAKVAQRTIYIKDGLLVDKV